MSLAKIKQVITHLEEAKDVFSDVELAEENKTLILKK